MRMRFVEFDEHDQTQRTEPEFPAATTGTFIVKRLLQPEEIDRTAGTDDALATLSNEPAGKFHHLRT